MDAGCGHIGWEWFKTGRCVVKSRINIPVSTAIAISAGLIVLLGYFIKIDLILSLRNIILQWAIILAAIALIIGVVNLISVHSQKMSTGESDFLNSGILLFSFVVTILLVGFYGPTSPVSMWIFNNIQVPIESSLMALLAVVLIYASISLLRRKLNLFSLVFVGTSLLILIGSVPILGIEVPGLYGQDGVRSLISNIPAVAGARGILLGVALGTVATGLRILIGSDRPYGG